MLARVRFLSHLVTTAASTFALLRTAGATTTVNSIVGASAYIQTAGSLAVLASNTVYGGMAGDQTTVNTAGNCSAVTGTQTCNTCVNNGISGLGRLVACNETAIRDATTLVIQYVSTNATAGVPLMKVVSTGGGTTTPAITGDFGTSGVTQANAGAQFVVSWQKLCAAATAGSTTPASNCASLLTGAYTMQVQVGPSADNNTLIEASTAFAITIVRLANDNAGASLALAPTSCPGSGSTGICYFELGPGDEKGFVANIQSDSNFPTEFLTPVTHFKSVRFFNQRVPSPIFDAASTAFLQITPASAHSDVAVAVDGVTKSLVSNRIMGLENDVGYYVKAAMVDVAGNVGYYTADADDRTCNATFPLQNNACHFVSPGAVYGVLDSNKCFIATAAYGSIMAPQVNVFRAFRNTVLIPSRIGRKFVEFYYEHSPKYAAIIARHEALRFASRVALAPLLGYAYLSLKIGTFSAALLFTALALFFATLGPQICAALGSALRRWNRP